MCGVHKSGAQRPDCCAEGSQGYVRKMCIRDRPEGYQKAAYTVVEDPLDYYKDKKPSERCV